MSSPVQTSTEQTSTESAAVTNPEQQGFLCGRVIRVVKKCGHTILDKAFDCLCGWVIIEVVKTTGR